MRAPVEGDTRIPPPICVLTPPLTYAVCAALSASLQGILLQRNFGSGLIHSSACEGGMPLDKFKGSASVPHFK